MSREGKRRGLTLVEATVSIVVVGVMLVAALNTVGATRVTERRLSDRMRGALLAQTLMAEILQQGFEEPGQAGSFGLEAGESGGSRAAWDDVDDYQGFKETGPRLKSGAALAGYNGWSWGASVHWVDPSDPRKAVVSATTVKRIRVVVSFRDTPVCELYALKSNKTVTTTETGGLLADLVDGVGSLVKLLLR
ncbi:MAG: type II secretion system GspH family protein [Phycisphaerae bacterium]|nr:type II secretion system protein [Phycisphaerae bacterium]MCZ2399852.1 type II secretion system GspH family protein [Phycisphaerae bacterium]NUQ48485.1 type II secretion system protein [Phycisphaerae bacterium]